MFFELSSIAHSFSRLFKLHIPFCTSFGHILVFDVCISFKVPWSRLGQDPVLVYLDRIFLLAEPATQVEGCSEDAVQEAKKSRIQVRTRK